MIAQPFSLLRPYADHLGVWLLTKEDAFSKDEHARELTGIPASASLWQVHGAECVIVDAPQERTQKADGLMTTTEQLLLTIRTADCQSFLVYAPDQHVVGLVHAGWRGLLAGVIPQFFSSLSKNYGVQASDVLVAAGPSLCQKCSDFTDPLKELPGIDPASIDGKTADLRGVAEQQLRDAGVDMDRFERHPDCTRCHPETYWTYRGGDKEAVQKGRTNCLACALLPLQ